MADEQTPEEELFKELKEELSEEEFNDLRREFKEFTNESAKLEKQWIAAGMTPDEAKKKLAILLVMELYQKLLDNHLRENTSEPVASKPELAAKAPNLIPFTPRKIASEEEKPEGREQPPAQMIIGKPGLHFKPFVFPSVSEGRKAPSAMHLIEQEGGGEPPSDQNTQSALIGYEFGTRNNPVRIGDVERRSGLYVLGKPGMGKSTLLVNLIRQDLALRRPVFFLDPHGSAIRDIFRTSPEMASYLASNRIRFIDPTDEEYAFAVNPLHCKNPASLKEREDAKNKTLDVFRRLWEKEDKQLGILLERILQSALPLFIEGQEYTLAEMPLFLMDAEFRRHVLGNIRYNTHLLDYWKYEFHPEQAQSALNRIGVLLSNRYVRDIIGQREWGTPAFEAYASKTDTLAVFVHLPATLDAEPRRFIGTIFLTELFHALALRPEEKRTQFCLYVDEFQQFATNQFADFILEGRKFGVATTIAHQERLGQFGENQKILGATMACANKVVFQCTVKDARELAVEFAEKPTFSDTRRQADLVVSRQPFYDLVMKGHSHAKIQEYVSKYLVRKHRAIKRHVSDMEQLRLERMDFLDEAALARDEAQLYGIEERRAGIITQMARGRDIPVSHAALNYMEESLRKSMASHNLAADTHEWLQDIYRSFQARKKEAEYIDDFLFALMEGREHPVRGNEAYATFFSKVLDGHYSKRENHLVVHFFIELEFGDPQQPRKVPSRVVMAMPQYRADLRRAFIAEYEDYYRKKLPEIRQEEAEDLKKNPWKRPYMPGIYESDEERIRGFAEGYVIKQFDESEFGLDDLWRVPCLKRNRKLSDSERYDLQKEMLVSFEDTPTHKMEERRLPLYLLPRVLSEAERSKLFAVAAKMLTQGKQASLNEDVLTVLIELDDFCRLLREPENHVKAPSNQYIEQPIHPRTIADMTNEAVQALTELPRFTAYAKIIEERGGEQSVWKGKIKTPPPPSKLGEHKAGTFANIEERITELTHEQCCRPRSEIEQEIANRRVGWRRTPSTQPEEPTTPLPSDKRGGAQEVPPVQEQTPRSDEPPPTWG